MLPKMCALKLEIKLSLKSIKSLLCEKTNCETTKKSPDTVCCWPVMWLPQCVCVCVCLCVQWHILSTWRSIYQERGLSSCQPQCLGHSQLTFHWSVPFEFISVSADAGVNTNVCVRTQSRGFWETVAGSKWELNQLDITSQKSKRALI